MLFTPEEQKENAAYVADLREPLKDTSARWRKYKGELQTLAEAFGYLKTERAAAEWRPALLRLVHAQAHTRAAAEAFDQRARTIAEIHETHRFAEIGRRCALEAAGFPEAVDWPIADADTYRLSEFNDWISVVPLAETVRRLVEQQDAHIEKVGRLSVTAG